MTTTTTIKAASVPLTTPISNEPPGEFRLWEFGEVNARWDDGHEATFHFDRQAAESVMQLYDRRGRDMSFDYNHAFQDTRPRSEADLRSAGSFELELRDDGLWLVNIRWTDDASRYIRQREYRYLSPAFHADPDAGRILELHNIALTPNPATLGALPLVASQHQPPTPNEAGSQETVVDPVVVGLTASATPAEVQLRATALHAFEGTVLEELTATSREDAIGKLKAIAARAAQSEELANQVQELTAAAEQSEREGLIKQALSDRKLTPAQTAEGGWAQSAPLESLKSFLASAPTVIPAAEATEPGAKSTDDGLEQLNAEIRRQAKHPASR